MQDRGVTNETGDEAALYLHYVKCHPDATNNLALSGAYRVFFLENPLMEFLDVSETFWVSKLRAKINKIRTFDSIVKF